MIGEKKLSEIEAELRAAQSKTTRTKRKPKVQKDLETALAELEKEFGVRKPKPPARARKR
jgi:hypothetical protein